MIDELQIKLRALIHRQRRIAVPGIDTPFDARDQIWFAVPVEIAWPRMGSMIGDPDWLSKATHCLWLREPGLIHRARIEQQIDTAVFHCSTVRAGDTVNQVLKSVLIPIDSAK